MRNQPLTFSIIIEWENAKLSELGRTRSMLATLAEQILKLDQAKWRTADIIILYDPVAINPAFIRDTVTTSMGNTIPVSAFKVLPAKNMRYYELKNFGAKHTDASILVFLDSDVIPEPDWLSTLLDGIIQPGVDAIGGNTYISPDSLYNQAFALFWFFPLRSEERQPVPSNHFFANNFAIRKVVFDKHPFPFHRKFRGQCTDLANTLRENNYGLFLHPAAKVSHPPPNGIYHFVIRALCAGHDSVVTASEDGHRMGVRHAWQRFFVHVRTSHQRIKTQRGEVNMGAIAAIAAQGLALAYYGLVFVGECVTLVKPDFISRRFPI